MNVNDNNLNIEQKKLKKNLSKKNKKNPKKNKQKQISNNINNIKNTNIYKPIIIKNKNNTNIKNNNNNINDNNNNNKNDNNIKHNNYLFNNTFKSQSNKSNNNNNFTFSDKNFSTFKSTSNFNNNPNKKINDANAIIKEVGSRKKILNEFVDRVVERSLYLFRNKNCITCSKLLANGKSTRNCPKCHNIKNKKRPKTARK
jgi:hypothetical protein